MPANFGTSSSYADRISKAYYEQFGKPADAADPAYADYVKANLGPMIQADNDAYARSKARWGVADKLAMGAALTIPTLGLGSAAFGGGAAASAAGGASAGAAGGATQAMNVGRLASIFSNPGFKVGVEGSLGIAGLVTQNKANAQARRDQLAAQTQAISLEQAKLAEQARNADLDRADAKALNDRIQALEEKKFNMAQEQAQWERSISETNQNYLNNYRTNVQGPAVNRLRSILGF